MSKDTIYRQDAIDEINERQKKLIYFFGFENDAVKIMDIAKSIITAIPPVQPERKKGKWIRGDIKGIPYCCSVCSERFYYEWKFCPNCGADMRERQADK